MRCLSAFGFILLLLIVTFSSGVFAQSGNLSGSVVDTATGEGLPYANIFINNTSLGTASDAKGNFLITGIPPGTIEVIVSYIGYKQSTATVMIKAGTEQKLVLSLTEDSGQLNEVEVTGTRDKAWEKQLKQFEKIFLGDNDFARQCRIQNPWVLEFNETKADGTSIFTASAMRPLVIDNLALGYTVTYYLKSFTATPVNYSIMGEIRFQELHTDDRRQANLWEQNRLEAWRGSYRHLFKAIIDGRAAEEGFNLYSQYTGTAIRESQNQTFSSRINQSVQVFESNGIVQPLENGTEYRIRLPRQLEVHYNRAYSASRVYRDITFPVSWLDVRRGYLDVNKDGIVVNASDLVVSGAMNEARIAHLLPNNYQAGDALRNIDLKAFYSAMKMKRLQEKVYIHTDKPYYYPGETIWFKAYLNYQTPELLDSLSYVLYVELADANNRIVQSRTLPVRSGMASDGIELPVNLPAGSYRLRSYTNWMLNYGEENFFTKSIPVLNEFQRVIPAEKIPDADTVKTTVLSVVTDQTTYKPREKVTLTIQLSDLPHVSEEAFLSVAVTDTKQVAPITTYKTIAQAYAFSEEQPFTMKPPQHPVEYGISLQGQHLNAKGKPAKTSVLMVVANLEDAYVIDTDDNGYFWASGMQFSNTATIGFQYVNRVKKPGRIVITERTIPPFSSTVDPLPFSIVEEKNPQRKRSIPETLDKAIMLDEIVTTDTALPPTEPVVSKGNYGKAEFILSGEALQRTNAFSLVDALRASVPGLNVVYSGGTPTIRFGGPSNFLGATTNEPLLIVDGIQSYGQDQTVYERLFQINPVQVERVEVIRNGGAAIYGSRGANGVIIVITRDRHAQAVASASANRQTNFFQTITLHGFSKPIVFQSPDYSKPAELSVNIQDNRSTIYWNPSVDITKNSPATVEFYAADTPSIYCIVIEGITVENTPIRKIKFIQISK